MLPPVIFVGGREYRLISDRGGEKIRLGTSSVGLQKVTLLTRFTEDAKANVARYNWRFEDNLVSSVSGAPLLQLITNVTQQFSIPANTTDNTAIADRLVLHLISAGHLASAGGGETIGDALADVILPASSQITAFMRGEQ